MSGLYEGDLIRPLGLVTLYFAYAEAEIDMLIDTLPSIDPYDNKKRQWNVGRKLIYAQKLTKQMHSESLIGLNEILNEAKMHFERRNVVIHSCIFAGGRMVSNRKNAPNQQISASELNQLAESIWACKEQINMYRCRHIPPLLAESENAN
ncbi:hypothetical protein Meth11DRAFT_1392 [Methylophilaceae bacterium 11]|nr:hypothetical protein Meth11DRAFT_1392 [Methylophilaceae bacterium 11]